MTQFERRAFSNGAKVERDRGNFSWSWQSSRRASRTRRRRRPPPRLSFLHPCAFAYTTTAADVPLLLHFVRAFLSIVRRRLIVPSMLFQSVSRDLSLPKSLSFYFLFSPSQRLENGTRIVARVFKIFRLLRPQRCRECRFQGNEAGIN